MFELAERVCPEETAVLVVDMQNDFCHPEGVFARRGAPLWQVDDMLPRLQNFLTEARKVGVAIIFIKTHHSSWTNSPSWLVRIERPEEICLPDTWGADFCGVRPEGNEISVVKHRYSAFVNTNLDLILRSRQFRNLIVTGINTNVCVDSTARHAYMLDYFVTVLEDCCATVTASPKEDHESALRLMKDLFVHVATSSEVIRIWHENHI
mgnify:CR=1 FL=1